MMPFSIQRQRGVTLVELMIGMVLGLMISGLAVFFFSAEKGGFREDQEIARMNENGRFALYVLTQDLQLADFWGDYDADPSTIDHAAVDGLTVGSSCVTSGDFDPTVSIESKVSDSGANVKTQFACLTAGDLKTVTVGGAAVTSALGIKRVDGLASGKITSTLTANNVYLRTNGTSGQLFQNGGGAPALPAGYTDWAYQINTYFIRNFSVIAGDGIPTLARYTLVSGPAMNQETLAEGIEYFHVLYGIDEDALGVVDGVASRFVSNPTVAQLNTVVAARVYVLVRSLNPVDGYDNDKTYTLGDITVAAANDKFYRRVYTSSVQVRNTRNRIAPL